MTTPQDASEVVPFLTSAATIMYVQRWLKSRNAYAVFVQAMPGLDKWAHWAVAALGSLIAAAGIHITFAGDYSHGWAFQGTIPDLMSVVHGAGDWANVYILQEWAYDTTRRPMTMPHDVPSGMTPLPVLTPGGGQDKA